MEVSDAIFEQYLPRFAGDIIPTNKVSIAVSLAEKIITLVGIFGINQLPKGDKDPFGLRRAAIGAIRIILENNLSINFKELISKACAILGDKIKSEDNDAQVANYVYNRLKAYYQDQNIEASIFLAVLSTEPSDLLDFDKRVKAVKAFKDLPEAENLASAYKRINNILSKNTLALGDINKSLLSDQNEIALANALEEVSPKVNDLYKVGNYQDALAALSKLKDPVDNFFENVMVNAEDQAIKCNRLSLLNSLHGLISKTADISVLY